MAQIFVHCPHPVFIHLQVPAARTTLPLLQRSEKNRNKKYNEQIIFGPQLSPEGLCGPFVNGLELPIGLTTSHLALDC